MLHPSQQRKVRIYSKSSALTAEATQYPKDTINVVLQTTLSLDVAPVNKNSHQSDNDFDWSEKISLQLSPTELPILVGLLLGYLPKCEFKRPTKGIYIERQVGNIYLKASSGSAKQYQMPIPIGHTFQLSAIAISQLQQQCQLNGDLLIAAVRGACSLYSQNR
jgi:hypothetical protein